MLISLPTTNHGMWVKMRCIRRITWVRTDPSPMPASNTRNAFSPGPTLSNSSPILSATTAADHNHIADAYGEEAAALRQKAADHKAMLASYDKGPGYLKEKTQLPQHCRSLIAYYEKAADDADAMAKTHRALAAKAKP